MLNSSATQKRTQLWFRCAAPKADPRIRLVCFPHAGGSAPFFRLWQRFPHDDVEIHAVQYPGHTDRIAEPLVPDAVALSATIAAELGPLRDRPIALFGHSMGALLAFETTRALGAGVVKHLFVSGANAPHRRDDLAPLLHPDDDVLMDNLADLGGTDAAVLANPDLRELVLPAVRNDLHLVDDYRYTAAPQLDCPITAFSGDRDTRDSTVKSWAELTGAPFTLHEYDGDHFFLEQHRESVLSAIHAALA